MVAFLDVAKRFFLDRLPLFALLVLLMLVSFVFVAFPSTIILTTKTNHFKTKHSQNDNNNNKKYIPTINPITKWGNRIGTQV